MAIFLSSVLVAAVLRAVVLPRAPAPRLAVPPIIDAPPADGNASAVIARNPEAQLQASQRARMLLDELPEHGGAPSQYTSVLRAFSEAAMPEECTSLLRRMRRETKVRPSLESYGFVVSALQAAGRTREATRWLRRVVQPEVSHSLLQRAVTDGEVVTRERYNRVLASYAAAGRPAEAVAAMKQMVNVGGVTPDIISFNCLIGAHATAGDPARARAWLERAAQWGVQPDVVTYTTVISGYARAAQPDQVSARGHL